MRIGYRLQSNCGPYFLGILSMSGLMDGEGSVIIWERGREKVLSGGHRMKRILVVIDMQNDFIDGALGTEEAVGIVDKVVEKIHSYSRPGDCVYATRDTHGEDYLETSEGKFLPVKHCVKGTKGWEIRGEVARALQERKAVIVDKPTFGSEELAQKLWEESREEETEIELVGLCTDICVVTNALLLKTKLPETKISVDSSCCAGVTPSSHSAALLTMKMCQIETEKGKDYSEKTPKTLENLS